MWTIFQTPFLYCGNGVGDMTEGAIPIYSL